MSNIAGKMLSTFVLYCIVHTAAHLTRLQLAGDCGGVKGSARWEQRLLVRPLSLEPRPGSETQE